MAWAKGIEHLAAAGVVSRPAETYDEFAQRAGTATEVDESVLATLAVAAREAAYSPSPPAHLTVLAAEEAVREVARQVAATTSVADRLRHQLDPRPLVPRRRSRQVTQLGGR